MKNAIIFLVVIFSFSATFAKQKAKSILVRKPSQAESASMIRFTIVYGEKTTVFVVSKNKSGGRVEYSNNMGAHGERMISSKDYEFLRSKAVDLKGPSNKKEFCERNYIEIVAKDKRMLGCLGALNKLAVDMQEAANLLSVLF